MTKLLGIAAVKPEKSSFSDGEPYAIAVFADQDDNGVSHSRAMSERDLEVELQYTQARNLDPQVKAQYELALRQIDALDGDYSGVTNLTSSREMYKLEVMDPSIGPAGSILGQTALYQGNYLGLRANVEGAGYDFHAYLDKNGININDINARLGGEALSETLIAGAPNSDSGGSVGMQQTAALISLNP